MMSVCTITNRLEQRLSVSLVIATCGGRIRIFYRIQRFTPNPADVPICQR